MFCFQKLRCFTPGTFVISMVTLLCGACCDVLCGKRVVHVQVVKSGMVFLKIHFPQT
jgi:hypothetical protein